MIRIFDISGRRRRGSTILIVIALLSVLVLLAITLMYTSKLEVLSSMNFADAVQRDTAAIDGAEEAMDYLATNLPEGAIGNKIIKYDLSEGDPPLSRTLVARSKIDDLSARMNLNYASFGELERLIGRVAADNGITLSVTPGQIATAIVSDRFGPDLLPGVANFDDNISSPLALDNAGPGFGFPCPINPTGPFSVNTLDAATGPATRRDMTCFGYPTSRASYVSALKDGIDDPDEYVADIRFPPFGDDRYIEHESQLLGITGVTQELYDALLPHVTVFSLSRRQRFAPSAPAVARDLLDVNRACAEDIYLALNDHYQGQKDDMLIRQFALNIVDYRDEDRRPTTMDNGNNTGFVFGFERQPFITEVYADADAPDAFGDDGQYVEIHNPWPESFNLDGWELRIGAVVIPLNGDLNSGEFLIVTDDYDDSDGNNWSFFDQFNIAENGTTRRIIEDPALDLPDPDTDPAARVRVQLYEVATGGNPAVIVDESIYNTADMTTTLNAFQRVNVVLRANVYNRATPFTRITIAPPTIEVADRLRYSPIDTPFSNLTELWEVFAGYGTTEQKEVSRFGYPVLYSPASTSPQGQAASAAPGTIDARIADIFIIEPTIRPNVLINPTGGPPCDAALPWLTYRNTLPGERSGRVNLNTASEQVLFATGFTPAEAANITNRRQLAEFAAIADRTQDGLVFEKLSDVIGDESLFGPRDPETCPNLLRMRPILDRIALNTRAFLVETSPLEAPSVTNSAGNRIVAYYGYDREEPDLAYWRFAP